MAHRFSNPDPAHRPHGARAIVRWGITDRLWGRRRRDAAGPPAPRCAPDLELIHAPPTRPTLTWIGHASFLGALAGRWFLIDPVFAGSAGPLYPRHDRPGLRPSELPRIAAVLVTHNHYDHLDAGALRGLPDEVPVVAPLGMGGWLLRRGRRAVHELGWWQSVEIADLSVTLVPARHWSRRGVFDTNRALWGGFVIAGGGRSLYHAGDTAWFDGFSEIGRRFAGLDLALLPIGAYRPAWFMEHQHLNPELAGRAFLEVGARVLVPMHWGAFQLADEPLVEPVDRLLAWWARNDPGDRRRLRVMAVGETMVLD